MQQAKPAAECGRIGHAIRIFDGGRSRFPAAAFHKTPMHGLHASRHTVVRVRKGEGRQHGEGFPALITETAADLNPVMLFIVRLLTATTMTNDRILFTDRASSDDDSVASRGPIVYGVAFPVGK